jgi:hypothetical protein
MPIRHQKVKKMFCIEMLRGFKKKCVLLIYHEGATDFERSARNIPKNNYFIVKAYFMKVKVDRSMTNEYDDVRLKSKGEHFMYPSHLPLYYSYPNSQDAYLYSTPYH